MAPHRHVHLVGSMNLPSAEAAMTAAGSVLGDHLLRLPDGEPGPRRGWIFYQRPMFSHHRQLGSRRDRAGTPDITAPRVVRPGVRPEDIEFPELGYAREAAASYAWFRRAKADGRIPAHLRFQVSLPTPYRVPGGRDEPDDIPLVEPAYEAAMVREVATICDAVPHDELALQWDVCIEMLQYDGRAGLGVGTTPSSAGAGPAHRRRARGRRPRGAPVLRRLRRSPRRRTGRRHEADRPGQRRHGGVGPAVAVLHVPVPIARDDNAYFAPFAGLRLAPGTELFLGLVHHGDGVEGSVPSRSAAAEPFVPSFGIATECGIGRAHTTPEVGEILAIHAAAASASG